MIVSHACHCVVRVPFNTRKKRHSYARSEKLGQLSSANCDPRGPAIQRVRVSPLAPPHQNPNPARIPKLNHISYSNLEFYYMKQSPSETAKAVGLARMENYQGCMITTLSEAAFRDDQACRCHFPLRCNFLNCLGFCVAALITMITLWRSGLLIPPVTRFSKKETAKTNTLT